MKTAVLAASQDFVKIVNESPWLSTTIAVCVTGVGTLYGTAEVTRAGMTLLLLLVIIDWISGFSAASKDKIDTSSYGIEGIYRTVVLMLLPAVGHLLDDFFYTQGIIQYFMIAALARHLLKSCIANIYRVGWTQWIPADVLDKLSDWVQDEIAHKTARAQERFDKIYKHKKGDDE